MIAVGIGRLILKIPKCKDHLQAIAERKFAKNVIVLKGAGWEPRNAIK
jgi:hypothetical protein